MDNVRIKVKDIQEGIIYSLVFPRIYFKKENGIIRKTRIYSLLNGEGFNVAEEITEDDKEQEVEKCNTFITVFTDRAFITQGGLTIALNAEELTDLMDKWTETNEVPF